VADTRPAKPGDTSQRPPIIPGTFSVLVLDQ
jgi:hypothetical protein